MVVGASEVAEASEVAVAGANGEGAIPKSEGGPPMRGAADPESKVTNVTPESAVHAPSEELKMPDRIRTSADWGLRISNERGTTRKTEERAFSEIATCEV